MEENFVGSIILSDFQIRPATEGCIGITITTQVKPEDFSVINATTQSNHG